MQKPILKKLSRIISEMFNGFLTMILIPTIAFWVSAPSLIYKILFPLLYILVTLVPFIILKRQGKVSDYEFTKREERPLYFTIVSIAYFGLFFLTTLLKIPALTHITLALFSAACVLTIVNLFWKMSGHMTYSTLLFFVLMYLFPYTSFLPLLFITLPFIAASRVILKKHTVMQTVIGTLVSATISILILYIL